MAVLSNIRKRSIFLIVIIAMALFAFVLADVIQNGNFFSDKAERYIGSVNGENIPRESFARKVEGMTQRLGPDTPATQAVNSTWDNELRTILLKQQYEKLGITATEADIDQTLPLAFGQNPAFQDENSQFSYNRYREYLSEIKDFNPEEYNYYLEVEASIAENAGQQAYLNMIRAGVGATSAEGKAAYGMENDKVNLSFVFLPYDGLDNADFSVSDSEIADYIKLHSDQYQAEAKADIHFVLFEESPSEADEREVESEIKALIGRQITRKNDTLPGFAQTDDIEEFVSLHSDVAYDGRWWFKHQLPEAHADSIFLLGIGDIYGPYKEQDTYSLSRVVAAAQIPDSVKVSHILITWDDLQLTEPKGMNQDAAKALADSLYSVVRSTPSRLGELATEFSDDPSAAQNNGDLGWLSPGGTVEGFEEYILNNPAGSVGQVETEFGYHVLYVEDRKNVQRAVQVANIIKRIDPSKETLDEAYRLALNFETKAATDGFTEVAGASSYTVRPVNRMAEMDENIPGLGNNRKIVSWAFDKDTKTGDIQQFNVRNGIAVVQLTRRNAEGLMSVSEATAEVMPILRNRKKAAQLKSGLQGKSVEDIAREKEVEVQTASAITVKNPMIPGAGREPKVAGTAFGLKEGQTSTPIKGENGVYIVQLTAINPAPDTGDYTVQTETVNNKRSTAINTQVFEALKKDADIKDNRAVFY